jgi:two-component system, NtrC family, nitrogen regulation response regulator NtrX
MKKSTLPFRVLIVDDYKPLSYILCQLFEPNKWFIQTAISGKECFECLEKQTFDLILLDLNLPDTDGLIILEKVKNQYPATEVIIFSGNTDASKVSKAMSLNAFDYIEKGGSIDINVLQSKVNRCYETIMEIREPLTQRSIRGRRLTKNVAIDTSRKNVKMIGQSTAIEQMKAKINKFAPFNIDILIGGENGTGKELVAKALHEKSSRSAYPFVSLNCAGLTETLLATELFGHVKGAFSGSDGEKLGFIRAAHGGTLFLDEIGEISLKMQAALLRVLETRKVIPVQGLREFDVDIRIISASNRKMKKGIEQGIIREDFYHRICQGRIIVPALKNRKEDIPLLVEHFLEEVAKEQDTNPKIISKDTLELLTNHPWTGNIRELRNTIRSLALTTEGNIILKSDVEEYFEDVEIED